MTIAHSITKDYLKTIISYNPETGEMHKLHYYRPNCVGKRIKNDNKNRYKNIEISGKIYKQHRIAWIYMTGETPAEIDHINGIRSDNRFCNLRVVTRSQNIQNIGIRKNNTSGYKGVCFESKKRKWRARIIINYKVINLGHYDCPKSAYMAYCHAAEKYHGEFARVA